MKRLAWLPTLALAACAAQQPFDRQSYTSRPSACRAGPERAALVADRGIGGTGAPPAQSAQQAADRGIGGTGIRNTGIGNTGQTTGIIGVVTGLGSICLAGKTVEIPEDVVPHLDGQPSDLAAVRTGQVVAVTAQQVGGALFARSIGVLHAVIGPIEATAPGAITVAGQQIRTAGASGPRPDATPGAWVAVSGLRRPDGVIEATRIDPAAPGLVTLRGELVRTTGAPRIGTIAIHLPPGSNLPAAGSIVVTGRLRAGILVADTAAIDPGDNPADTFGPATNTFIIEGYVTARPGGYVVNHTFVAAPAPDAPAPDAPAPGVPGPARRAILAFERTPDGKFRADTSDTLDRPGPATR